MSNYSFSSRQPSAGWKRVASALCLGWMLGGAMMPAQAVDLADGPMFTTTPVPGNLALALSVEWPTATTPAYPSTVAYTAGSTYLGYFDPEKCYKYSYNSTTPASSYFAPFGAATSHVCTSTSSDPLWSGNYLNWASVQTLDAFRWVLTGGYRSVDTVDTTILTKTNALQDSTVMPHKLVTASTSGFTPFDFASVSTKLRAIGTAMYATGSGIVDCSFSTEKDTKKDTYSCFTGAGTKSCSKIADGSTCLQTVSTAARLSCKKSKSGANYTYTCNIIDSEDKVQAQCAATVKFAADNSASASCVVTPSTPTYPVIDYTGQSTAAGTGSEFKVYRLFMSVKVCDPTIGLESNCVAYGSNAKPEGLMQANASKLRYATFGYYNHSGDGSQERDGGVLRARMKYIGPTKQVPGYPAEDNGLKEWSSSTGIMAVNPDPADATATTAFAAAAGWTVPITNSGVMNYLNKFGNTSTNYKSKDPVGELYYSALRYFRNLGNVASYSTLANAGNSATAVKWLEGFPVIATWDDPVLYSCQKNFVLGIGDVNTWKDTNLPGSVIAAADPLEPNPQPTEVSGDTTVNVTTATNMVGKLEGYAAELAKIYGDQGNTTCPGAGSQCNGYLMAGLAYDAHTKDIRTDLTGEQNVNTYWMDVLENQVYKHKNQYWLAAKYGGFTVPDGFDPYSASNSKDTIPETAWYNNTDTLKVGTAGLVYEGDAGTGTGYYDKRPDNYFPGNRPELMKSGLTKAFAKIIKDVDDAYTTSLSTPSPNISSTGGISFAATYDPRTWTGNLTASTVTYDSEGKLILTPAWGAASILDAMAYTDRKVVTCCTTAGAGMPFTALQLAATSFSRNVNHSFDAVPNVSGTQTVAGYVAYLRGARVQEVANGGQYRDRGSRMGDVVNSKPAYAGAPGATYYDIFNPGYSSFVRSYAARTPVVYVGANDGMLHAFDGSTAMTNSGKELFAYIPSFLYGTAASAKVSGLASLGDPVAFSHHYFVNARPVVVDVDLAKTDGAATDAEPNWATLLVGGLGKGGKGYFAMNVTDPSAWTDESEIASKLLWEFTHANLGYSFGAPAMAKTKQYGWVVIVTSGYNNADGKGYFFLINPRTGALLQSVATSEGSAGEPINLGPASCYVSDYTDYTCDAIYAGDLRGNVWRADITAETGTYAEATKLAVVTNAAGATQPITVRPLIEVDPATDKRYVLFGTGKLLSDSDIANTSLQGLYSVADGKKGFGEFYTASGTAPNLPLPGTYAHPLRRADLNANTDLTAGIGSSPVSPMGWYYDLGTVETESGTSYAQFTNVDAAAALGMVAFGVNASAGSVCSSAGSGRIYSLTIGTGLTNLVDDDGELLASTADLSGVVTELGYRNVGGTIRLAGGLGDGSTAQPPTDQSGGAGMKRLNWREIGSTR